MELTWVDSSVRHAAMADVVITPRFGPASWRSFQMADRFLAAGREAAAQQLEALGTLTTPLSPGHPQSQGASSSRIVVSSSRRHSEGSRKEFTLEDVKGILIDLIGLPAHAVPDDPNASFEELGLDSIGFLEVQIEMEQRYGLRIPEADAQQIRTLSDAVVYVNRRLHENG
jgi:acyl carrier protein